MPLDQQEIAQLRQWPHREAKALIKALRNREPKSGSVLFETGFGPSGLPHIGTFAEVARTTWVRSAYSEFTGQPTQLYAFSDDLDGLRKVPDNMPNKAMLEEHLGKPLCDIPDPFEQHESYSGHMNAKLKEFLDRFGFEYEFKASHQQYRAGVFNDGLNRILQKYEEVRQVILPTLSPENRENWSPFFPICEQCGRVNSTRVIDIDKEAGTITYACDHEHLGSGSCGHRGDMPVTDGHTKVGWKVDWALRWYTYGVNYEMYGKDLIDSAKLSGKICRILGEPPPIGMFYEMFLDEHGAKISKSKGTGLTIDEWLAYGPLESLGLFIFKKPHQATRLHFDVIPQHVDEYLQHRSKWHALSPDQQKNSPMAFIHDEAPEQVRFDTDLVYGMLLNLVSVLNTDSADVVWDYILRYRPESDKDRAVIDKLVHKALAYYRDFVEPTKEYKLPSDEFRPAVDSFLVWLEEHPDSTGEDIQSAAYAAGKEADVDLRQFFRTMYELLLGQSQGPRIGTFIQLYGQRETLELAKSKLQELSGGM